MMAFLWKFWIIMCTATVAEGRRGSVRRLASPTVLTPRRNYPKWPYGRFQPWHALNVAERITVNDVLDCEFSISPLCQFV